ncbi:MAG: hypothetical protein ACQEQ0_11170 [Bacteroidota bacterium]
MKKWVMQKLFSPVIGIFFVGIMSVSLAGCDSKEKKQKETVVSEGIVEYRISYDQQTKNRSFSFLLPDKMEYFFRPGQERISFKGNMGLYGLDFISNHENDSSTTLLKVFNNKLYVPSSESKGLFIFDTLQEGEVTLQKDSLREIMGYEARKAIVRHPDSPGANIEVWYAPEISAGATNKNTPFAKIPGVMLEFAIYYNDVWFSLKSESIEKTELSDDVFEIPEDYRVTSINEIEKMVAEIMK